MMFQPVFIALNTLWCVFRLTHVPSTNMKGGGGVMTTNRSVFLLKRNHVQDLKHQHFWDKLMSVMNDSHVGWEVRFVYAEQIYHKEPHTGADSMGSGVELVGRDDENLYNINCITINKQYWAGALQATAHWKKCNCSFAAAAKIHPLNGLDSDRLRLLLWVRRQMNSTYSSLSVCSSLYHVSLRGRFLSHFHKSWFISGQHWGEECSKEAAE